MLVDYALGDAMLPRAVVGALEDWSLPNTPMVWVLAAAAGSLALFALNSALDVGLSWAASFAALQAD